MTLFDSLRACIREERPVALATVVAGPDSIGNKILVFVGGEFEGQLTGGRLTERVAADAARLLRDETAKRVTYETNEGTYDIFVDVFPTPPKLLIVGATDTAIRLSGFAKALGYRVTVLDARAAFARPERFPDADQVLKGWPQDILPTIKLDDATYVVLLSHDPKFDQPTLEHVIPSPVRYIGAIGSRRTQQARFQRLREQGFSHEQLARIYGPVGLNIGAHTVEETALAILAEVTAVRRGAPGGFMRP